jgi:alpha-ribazole phosphatase CobZ
LKGGFNVDIRELLQTIGITIDDITDTAMQLWVPHPGVETIDKARHIFNDELSRSFLDPNLCILIYAGIALERDARNGLIPNLHPHTYSNDLTCLIADEVLGMSIAMYIGGYKGHFDYIRFDNKKPGILGKLGPFMDDVIAGLIGGVSSNMYDRGITNDP